jgi:hypothetical protein
VWDLNVEKGHCIRREHTLRIRPPASLRKMTFRCCRIACTPYVIKQLDDWLLFRERHLSTTINMPFMLRLVLGVRNEQSSIESCVAFFMAVVVNTHVRYDTYRYVIRTAPIATLTHRQLTPDHCQTLAPATFTKSNASAPKRRPHRPPLANSGTLPKASRV